MRSFDLSPLMRSTVGFDRLVELFNEGNRVEPVSNWPAYDIARIGDDRYRITMAVAGFGPDELHLVQQGNTLTVSGERRPVSEKGGEAILHRGMRANAFQRSFALADHVEVTGASLEHGLLDIELRREVPAELRARRIEIATDSVGGRASSPAIARPEGQNQAA